MSKKAIGIEQFLKKIDNNLVELVDTQKLLTDEVLKIDNNEALKCSVIKNKAFIIGNAIDKLNSIKYGISKMRLDGANFILNSRGKGLDNNDIQNIYKASDNNDIE